MHPRHRYHLLVADAGALRAALRRNGGRAAARPARGDGRQGQHGRVRDGLLHRELGVLPHSQPVGHRARARGQQRRPGRGGRRRRVRLLPRLGHGRKHPAARVAVRHRRHEAHVRAGQPLRPGGLRKLARPDRPADERRNRQRHRAQRHSRQRSPRLHVDPYGAARLHRGPHRRRARPAGRRAARVLRGGHRPCRRGHAADGAGKAGEPGAQSSKRRRCPTPPTHSRSITSWRRRRRRPTWPATTA